MSSFVRLDSFLPGPRSDGTPWTAYDIAESATRRGTFVLIDTQPLDPLDTDPANPMVRTIETGQATLDRGWYRVTFRDVAGVEQAADPVYFPSGPAYTTIDDLRDALAPVADQSSKATAAELSDSELLDQIVEAGREVDARLAGRYTVPFALDGVPAVVATLTRDVAAYLATLTHRRYRTTDDRHPVVLRYQRAESLLSDLQAGKATLEGGGEGPGPSPEAAVVNPLLGEGSLFTPAGLGLGPPRIH